MKLILPLVLRGRIEAEARNAFPRECCGLIEGLWRGDAGEAMALYPARNLADRSDRFEIHPEDHFAALKAARDNGRTLIGCYHSHPNGSPVLSATDRSGAGEVDFLWLIAALTGPHAPVLFGAFAYSAAGFLTVDLDGPFGADLVTSSA
ncbi:MAG TPA: M67 family metallopeptidase [Rhizomicrobium sp.]|jgi:proteasome lid subunit RPN8/RPN11|nr:M67 family metallopeptidase [Rhizomicrobium sp.]